MLVERRVYDAAVALAEAYVKQRVQVGAPCDDGPHIGPVASAAQYERVQALIGVGIAEGARLVCGGAGPPAGFPRGYYCRPTIFADVDPSMRIAREEVFGPVLCMAPFDNEEYAVRLANDSPYGLTSYVQSGDEARVRRVVPRLRAGMVEVNGARCGSGAPFGGIKGSGYGREGGVHGLREFLNVKSVAGWPADEPR